MAAPAPLPPCPEQRRVSDVIRLLSLYRPLIDAFVIDFFTEGLWAQLPPAWQNALASATPSQLATLLGGPGGPGATWPLSLLAFAAAARALALPRGRPRGSPCPPCPPCQSPRLHPLLRRHVKPKKQHEIQRLGKLLRRLSRATGCERVVDVGAGQGHLSRFLSFGLGLSVTAVESDARLAGLAQRFDQELLRELQKTGGTGHGGHPQRRPHPSQRRPLTPRAPHHVPGRLDPSAPWGELLLPPDPPEPPEPGPAAQNPLGGPGGSEDGGPVLVTGLHACGDPSPALLPPNLPAAAQNPLGVPGGSEDRGPVLMTGLHTCSDLSLALLPPDPPDPPPAAQNPLGGPGGSEDGGPVLVTGLHACGDPPKPGPAAQNPLGGPGGSEDRGPVLVTGLPPCGDPSPALLPPDPPDPPPAAQNPLGGPGGSEDGGPMLVTGLHACGDPPNPPATAQNPLGGPGGSEDGGSVLVTGLHTCGDPSLALLPPDPSSPALLPPDLPSPALLPRKPGPAAQNPLGGPGGSEDGGPVLVTGLPPCGDPSPALLPPDHPSPALLPPDPPAAAQNPLGGPGGSEDGGPVLVTGLHACGDPPNPPATAQNPLGGPGGSEDGGLVLVTGLHACGDLSPALLPPDPPNPPPAAQNPLGGPGGSEDGGPVLVTGLHTCGDPSLALLPPDPSSPALLPPDLPSPALLPRKPGPAAQNPLGGPGGSEDGGPVLVTGLHTCGDPPNPPPAAQNPLGGPGGSEDGGPVLVTGLHACGDLSLALLPPDPSSPALLPPDLPSPALLPRKPGPAAQNPLGGPGGSEDGGPVLVTGLHACGDLSPALLRHFARSPAVAAVASVGCCYMKVSVAPQPPGCPSPGYPLSATVAALPGHQLSYRAREAACHALEEFEGRLRRGSAHLRAHCYRATLESIICGAHPGKRHLGVQIRPPGAAPGRAGPCGGPAGLGGRGGHAGAAAQGGRLLHPGAAPGARRGDPRAARPPALPA
ncbi:methyltransferase-like protein 25B isoform X2 [Pithys albifrons albifrons]|uniref:methyltransferase-like protein 25B isoform X2 n=1 Tax=Pithys albifrons albifrons TaxID=3385563 RepID=UPI003A5CB6E8